jgi:hypothetical protein
VLRVGHLLHPVDGLSVKRLRDGNVGHCSNGRSAVPMLLTSGNPDDVARADLLFWTALTPNLESMLLAGALKIVLQHNHP